VIVGILLIAAAAISAIAVNKGNFSAPEDYEECTERAARDAKSIDALSMLCGALNRANRTHPGARAQTGATLHPVVIVRPNVSFCTRKRDTE
jgi:hypothetical protein